ncbi:MAG: hypothetical protein ACX93I_10060 [Winogradskyella sp.]
MQKRIINGFLITLCIIIYGAIFFKAFWKKEEVNSSPLVADSYTNFDLKVNTDKDSIELFFPTRSPFGEPSKISNVASKTQSKKSETLKKEPTKKTWPRISYFGFVKNSANNQKLAVVKVNDNLFRKREGDYLDDKIKILRAYSDSIIVSYGKDLKTVIRN